MAEETPATEQQQQFAIQKIYLKDMSYEAPNVPHCFTQPWKPEMNINLSWEVNPLSEDQHEVVLSITVTAKLEEKTAFLVEVQQAGIFTAKGFANEELSPLLGSYCPNLLFPFAREAISDLVAKGGFPQMLLAPVNFEALYAQRLQEQQEKKQAESTLQH